MLTFILQQVQQASAAQFIQLIRVLYFATLKFCQIFAETIAQYPVSRFLFVMSLLIPIHDKLFNKTYYMFSKIDSESLIA